MRTIQQQSVQSLYIEMRFNGLGLATGTGFVTQSKHGPVLVTNRHNVTGRNQTTNQPLDPKTGAVPNEFRIFHNQKGMLGQWIPKLEPLYTDDDQPRWIEHPRLKHRADIVALPLTSLDDVELYPYDIGDGNPSIPVAPSDYVSVVGFPFGLRPGLGACAVWATGFIASEPIFDHDQLPVFLIDCRARPGQSGSPVILHRSSGAMALVDGNTAIIAGALTRFLGVYSGRINEQSDLGMVWKAQAVRELVDSI